MTHTNAQSDTPADLRVLLWDVDGTLMRSARRGVFLDYTRPALERVMVKSRSSPRDARSA